jgi:hypothetical protein
MLHFTLCSISTKNKKKPKMTNAKIYVYKIARNAFSPPRYVTVTAYSACEAQSRIIKEENQPDYVELSAVQNIDPFYAAKLDNKLNI